jgi:hypothetical protein
VTEPSTSGEDNPTGARRRRLGELLVAARVLTIEQVEEAIHRRLPGERFGSVLLRIGFASEDDIADAVAAQLRLPRVDVTYERPPAEVIDQVPVRLAERHDHVVCPLCAMQLAVKHCEGCGRGVEDAWSTCPWCRHPLGR